MLEKSPERKQRPAIVMVGKRGTVSVHCQGDQAGSLVYYIRTFTNPRLSIIARN